MAEGKVEKKVLIHAERSINKKEGSVRGKKKIKNNAFY